MDDSEASSFETSETLAALFASTQLLSNSWRLCSSANSAAEGGFLVEQVGSTTYIAFSGVQATPAGKPHDLVPLDAATGGLFRGLKCHVEGEEVVMVDGAMVQVFLSVHARPDFQSQITEVMKQTKAVVITGHSMGATIASLTALWLLCYLKSIFSPLPVLCITFGSPLLGNESFSNAIVRERWGGRFCHVVSSFDILPRLYLAPLASVTHHLNCLLHYWNVLMGDSQFKPHLQLNEEDQNGLLVLVLSHLEMAATEGSVEDRPKRSFWPFGSYLLCSKEGGICVDNAICVIKMMRLMMLLGSANDSIQDHLKYGDYETKLSFQFLMRRQFIGGEDSESSYEASVSMALQSSGTHSQEYISPLAKDCLKIARRVGRAPNINSANLAIRMSKIVPFRAEIEWYKAICDESPEQCGYYDSFKKRGVTKRESRVNMNRIKLGNFWDDVLRMWERNELPHDFAERHKWINGSHFYKLLVEPLEIAEYYRTEQHHVRGHYMTNGRERRFEIFDRWWKEGGTKDERKRSKYASLSQDSCFWAKVEEARDLLDCLQSETDPGKKVILLNRISQFETYAVELIENKDVSCDVVAANSSYSLWAKEWQALKRQLQLPFV